jgi:hypothetical protein
MEALVPIYVHARHSMMKPHLKFQNHRTTPFCRRMHFALKYQPEYATNIFANYEGLLMKQGKISLILTSLTGEN